jgi:hypothetical protein
VTQFFGCVVSCNIPQCSDVVKSLQFGDFVDVNLAGKRAVARARTRIDDCCEFDVGVGFRSEEVISDELLGIGLQLKHTLRTVGPMLPTQDTRKAVGLLTFLLEGLGANIILHMLLGVLSRL